jgi:predicted nucleic acid-binding protein
MLGPQTAHRGLSATTRVAERHALSLYNAAYLECAARRRLPLATLDRPLATAAAALGLETLGLP